MAASAPKVHRSFVAAQAQAIKYFARNGEFVERTGFQPIFAFREYGSGSVKHYAFESVDVYHDVTAEMAA